MYYIISYFIGEIKYKQIFLGDFDNREDAANKYSELLQEYIDRPDFVLVLLAKTPEDTFNIVTCWALQTPKELQSVQKQALDQFRNGENLYNDPNLKLINIIGSTIYDELKDIFYNNNK